MASETLTKTETGLLPRPSPDGTPTASTEQETFRPSDYTGDVLVERYQLLRKLGEGGMGQVYEARHLRLGRRVAVKLLHGQYARQDRHRKRFMREAKALASLYSHYIVQVTDFGETADGLPFMVMEYLEGEDLRQRLNRQGLLSISEAISLILDACEGVSDAHAQGLVHRDLKPENLFITRGRGGVHHCKVLDFGVAKARNATTVTREGALVGTVQYMAPEQVRGEKNLDERVDIFGLGAILFECLCGAPAFDGDKPEVILYKILHEDVPALSSLNGELPFALERIVQRAMARDPEARFQTVAELALALGEFNTAAHRPTLPEFVPGYVANSGNSAQTGPVAPSLAHEPERVADSSLRARGRRRLWATLAAGAALLAAGGSLAWTELSGNSGQDAVRATTVSSSKALPRSTSERQPASPRETKPTRPSIAPELTSPEHAAGTTQRATSRARSPFPDRNNGGTQSPTKSETPRPAEGASLELDPNPYR